MWELGETSGNRQNSTAMDAAGGPGKANALTTSSITFYVLFCININVQIYWDHVIVFASICTNLTNFLVFPRGDNAK